MKKFIKHKQQIHAQADAQVNINLTLHLRPHGLSRVECLEYKHCATQQNRARSHTQNSVWCLDLWAPFTYFKIAMWCNVFHVELVCARRRANGDNSGSSSARSAPSQLHPIGHGWIWKLESPAIGLNGARVCVFFICMRCVVAIMWTGNDRRERRGCLWHRQVWPDQTSCEKSCNNLSKGDILRLTHVCDVVLFHLKVCVQQEIIV